MPKKERAHQYDAQLLGQQWLLGPIAHRGLAGPGGVENSMEAFCNCLRPVSYTHLVEPDEETPEGETAESVEE